MIYNNKREFEMKKPIDIGFVMALSWMLIALGITIFIGPMLGARGWLWLLIHHVLCLIGVTHEFRRYKKRQALRTRNP